MDVQCWYKFSFGIFLMRFQCLAFIAPLGSVLETGTIVWNSACSVSVLPCLSHAGDSSQVWIASCFSEVT